MDFFDLIATRRSVRRFTPQPIDKEIQEKLMESALRAPSSRSINPWRFIAVSDRDTIEALSKTKPHGASFLKNAPFCIVVCGNIDESDVWVEDTAIASTFVHLAAHALGLGSCWIQIRKRQFSTSKSASTYVKDLLKIPDNIEVESIIAIGHPDETKKGHTAETLHWDKRSVNTYGPDD